MNPIKIPGSVTGVSKQKCNLCNKLLTSKYKLENHIRQHTGELPYKCVHCEKCYHSKDTMSAHVQAVHFRPTTKTHKCNICSKLFLTRAYLTTHSKIHSGKKPYKCQTCAKGFITISKLKRHELIHSGKKSHQCTKCARKFVSVDGLRVHMSTHEIGPRRYKCPLCPRVYRQCAGYSHHFKRMHSSNWNPPHCCIFCGKEFNTKAELFMHLLHHTREKPHSCELCNREFAASGDKYKHIRKVHTGEERIHCSTCSGVFATMRELQFHLDNDENKGGLKCGLCEMTFKRIRDLGCHKKRVHFPNKPEKPLHVCEECGKEFRMKMGLSKHLRAHNKEKWYKCSECGRNYKTKGYFNKHIQLMHTNRFTRI